MGFKNQHSYHCEAPVPPCRAEMLSSSRVDFRVTTLRRASPVTGSNEKVVFKSC